MKSFFVVVFLLLIFQGFGINLNSNKNEYEFENVKYESGTYTIKFDILGIKDNYQRIQIISMLNKMRVIQDCKIENLTHCTIVASESLCPNDVRTILKSVSADIDLINVRRKKVESNQQEVKTEVCHQASVEQELYIKRIVQLNGHFRGGFR